MVVLTTIYYQKIYYYIVYKIYKINLIYNFNVLFEQFNLLFHKYYNNLFLELF